MEHYLKHSWKMCGPLTTELALEKRTGSLGSSRQNADESASVEFAFKFAHALVAIEHLMKFPFFWGGSSVV